MDQSHPALPLRSAKARKFGELWREKMCARALDLSISTGQSQSAFSTGQKRQWKATLEDASQSLDKEPVNDKKNMVPFICGVATHADTLNPITTNRHLLRPFAWTRTMSLRIFWNRSNFWRNESKHSMYRFFRRPPTMLLFSFACTTQQVPSTSCHRTSCFYNWMVLPCLNKGLLLLLTPNIVGLTMLRLVASVCMGLKQCAPHLFKPRFVGPFQQWEVCAKTFEILQK